MAGTLYTAKIGIDLPKADYYLFIVRSAQNLHPDIIHNLKNYYHEPTLSPSPFLFRQYLDLKARHKWNSTTYSEIFVPAFEKEMKNEPMKSSLNDLEALLKAGYNVCIMCWCGSLCHRDIVADDMERRGFKVIRS